MTPLIRIAAALGLLALTATLAGSTPVRHGRRSGAIPKHES
jgi:hypothetical protein